MSLYKECFGKLETIVNTKTGEIEKFEYLIRHKDFTPMELLHKIEQNNELDKLFIYQLEDSVRLCKEHNIKISLNIDNSVVSSPFVLETLKKYKKNELKNIEFELLETDIDMNNLKEFIEHIQNLGVRVNIDDFGSDKQTFERVKDIKEIAGKKLKTIKIDGSLIKKLMIEDKEAMAMIKEIVKYAKEHNIKIVSEYIDCFEKFDKVKGFSDYVQGFMFDSLNTNNEDFSKNLQSLEVGIKLKLEGKLRGEDTRAQRRKK